MTILVTCRHFKAHESINAYAEATVGALSHFFDGIVKAEVVLSYEKSRNSVKIAEVTLSVHNAVLTGVARTNDFMKSIDGATEKVLVQLKKYKERLHARDRKAVRRIREKV